MEMLCSHSLGLKPGVCTPLNEKYWWLILNREKGNIFCGDIGIRLPYSLLTVTTRRKMESHQTLFSRDDRQRAFSSSMLVCLSVGLGVKFQKLQN